MARKPSSQKPSARLQNERVNYRGVLDTIKVQEKAGRLPFGDNVGGKDNDVLGLMKSKVRLTPGIKYQDKKVQGFGEGKQSIGVNFAVPSTRNSRPVSAAGSTSFHFSHGSITKTRKQTVAASGTVNKPGAAKEHVKYIERDGAVAIDDRERAAAELAIVVALEAAAPSVTNDAQRQVPGDRNQEKDHGEQAARNAEARRNPNPAEVRARALALAIFESSNQSEPGIGEARSIDSLLRLSDLDVVSHDDPFEALLLDAQDADLERAGASYQVLRRPGTGDREDDGGGIAGSITDGAGGGSPPSVHGSYVERQEALARAQDGSRVLFTNISDDAAVRAKVWDKIEEFERDRGKDTITLNTAITPDFWAAIKLDVDCPAELKRALSIAQSGNYRFQTEDGTAIRQWLTQQDGYDPESSQAHFADGRGGRTQYRIIAELPHDLPLVERASVLKEFTQPFEDRKLPYVAVMHAPDHTNDSRNWHFHLVYYDRPIALMPDGRWDFEVKEPYVNKKHWNYGKNFPHRQNKDRDVTKRSWIPNLRRQLSEITNEHLERAGISRRLDPRTYSEMGIHREPQEHLGTKTSALEAMGVVTPIGAENAHKEWDELMRRVGDDKEREEAKTDRQVDKWEHQVKRTMTNPDDIELAHARIGTWRQTQDEATEYRSMASMALRHYQRTISRAERTIDICNRKIEAVESKKAKNFEGKGIKGTRERRQAALNFIWETKNEQVTMLKHAEEWSKLSTNAEGLAVYTAEAINRQLALAEAANACQAADAQFPLGVTRTSGIAGTAKNTDDLKQTDVQDKAAEDTRRQLSREEMNAFVTAVIESQRRLVHRNRKVVPSNASPEEQSVIDARNYSAITLRLDAVRRKQDAMIQELAEYMDKNPLSVVRRQATPQRQEIAFFSPNPKHMTVFRNYRDDPILEAAMAKAMVINDKRDASSALARDTTRGPRQPAAPAPNNLGIQSTEASTTPASNSVAPDVTPRPTRPNRDLNPVIDELTKAPVRMHTLNGRTMPDKAFLAAVGVDEAEMLSDAFQKRLRGIQNVQQREIHRLEGFVRTRPDALVVVDGKISLHPSSPPELVLLADKWKDDALLQRTLVQIADDGMKERRAPTSTTSTTGTGGGSGGRTGDRADQPPAAAPTNPQPTTEQIARQAEASRAEQASAARVERDRATRSAAAIEAAQRARQQREASNVKTSAGKASDANTKAPAGQTPNSPANTAETPGASIANPSRGITDRIDAWLDAEQAGRPEPVQRKLAAAVTSDPRSRDLLPTIDPKVARDIEKQAAEYRRGIPVSGQLEP